MEEPAVMIMFPDQTKARGAFDTLLELGYKPEMLGSGLMDVKIEQQDITTALEIVDAFGGEIQEENSDIVRELITPDISSKGDTEFSYLSIPAHTVNEDLDEAYLSGETKAPSEDSILDDRNYSDDDDFGGTYGGFSGSVKA